MNSWWIWILAAAALFLVFGGSLFGTTAAA